MTSTRTIAAVTGVLFLITFITSIPAAFVLYPPVLNDPNYIISAGADSGVKVGALLEVILVVANIGTAVVLYPLLKRQNHIVALGYVTARVMEGAMIAVGILSLLSVVILRQEFAGTAGADAAALVPIGRALVAVHDWTFLLGPGFLAPLGNGILLGYLMNRSGLMPRGLTMLGLIRRSPAHRGVCRRAVRSLRASLPAGSHSHDPGVLVGAVAWHLPGRQRVPAVPDHRGVRA